MKSKNVHLEVYSLYEDEYGKNYERVIYRFYDVKSARDYFKELNKNKSVEYVRLWRHRNDCTVISDKVLLDRRNVV